MDNFPYYAYTYRCGYNLRQVTETVDTDNANS